MVKLRESSKDRKPRAPKPEYKRPNVGKPADGNAPCGVFDGQERLGHVVERSAVSGAEFVAHNRRGEAFGVYDSWHAAAAAICRRAVSEGQ